MIPPRACVLRAFGWSAAGWVLLALIRTSLRVAAVPRPFAEAARLFGTALLASLPWLLSAPLVVWLAAGLSWRRGDRLRTSGTYLGLALVLSLADAAWVRLVLPVVGYPMTLPPGVVYLVRLEQSLFLYAGLVGIGLALRHRRRLEQAVLRGARLEAQLLHARLHVLALQLHPHFLFNTLNAVSELVHRDASAARTMLESLGELLRRSLDGGAAQEVTLREELALLEPYAGIQCTRFAGSLEIVVDADPATLDARVPRLVLQPLVENGIRHGTSRRAGPGRVTLRARSAKGRLVIEVEDDGAGLAGRSEREGLGLGNTRARLRQLYDHDARITVEPAAVRGAITRLECPLRFDPAAVATGPEVIQPEPPDEPPRDERVPPVRVAAALAAAWFAVAVIGGQEEFLAGRLTGEPQPFTAAFLPRLGEAVFWLALTGPVFWASARLARSALGWPVLIAAHVAVGLATIVAHLGLVRAWPHPAMDGAWVTALLLNDLCVYIALAAGAHAWTVRGVAAGRRAAAARLDAELAATRLELLRWRLSPDLLYDALRHIGELATDDASRADELTGRLGELLRLMLQSGRVELVPLGSEIDLVSAYLEVESAVRSEPAFLELSVDRSSRSALMPAVLLQPLVEALGGRRIAIGARLRIDALELEVRSSGPSPISDGLVDALRRRLDPVYRGAHRLAVVRDDDECTVTLLLPRIPDQAGRAVA